MIRLHGYEIKPTLFPDGTHQVWHLPEPLLYRDPVVTWNFESENELLHLMSLRALFNNRPMSLHVPFLPWARQDRMIDNDLTFNFDVLAPLINSLHCEVVTAVDVHNVEAAKRVLNNFRNISVADIQADVMRRVSPHYLVFPDAGASARYGYLKLHPHIVFDKDRDLATGEVKGVKPERWPKFPEKTAVTLLVIDDICDGGKTFIKIAEWIKTSGGGLLGQNVFTLYLFTTHGIYSQGKTILGDAGYKYLFTTTSLVQNFSTGYHV